jgi:hypothetical protein
MAAFCVCPIVPIGISDDSEAVFMGDLGSDMKDEVGLFPIVLIEDLKLKVDAIIRQMLNGY